ncbi:hypothetical protein BKA82DRAFT_16510, partial [Pisolithus tinctorius]
HTKNATADPHAWDIMMAFANGTIKSLPEAEEKLLVHLGHYKKEVTHHTAGLMQNHTYPFLPELNQTENNLMGAIDDLHARKYIQGTRLTFEELLTWLRRGRLGGDADIAAEVKQGCEVQSEESNSDNECSRDESNKDGNKVTLQQGIKLYLELEKLSLQHANISGLDIHGLQSQLLKLHAHLYKVQFQFLTQVSLDCYFSKKSPTP